MAPRESRGDQPEGSSPTERELQILRVLWERGESSVREIYEVLREELPIVQNTVQAFLRTMTEKGLVTFRKDGRRFLYQPAESAERTRKHLVRRLMDRAFDGSVDALVEKAFEARRPGADEIARLRELLDEFDRGGSTPTNKRNPRRSDR
ncbi:MAG: BlaI/MecI/CopY family transcriptional regulator [Planctomycetota bacterium]